MKIIILILLVMLTENNIYSQNPTYSLTAKNFNIAADDSLMFDIYLLHTNPGSAEFKYAAGQYFFRFNPLIANGGSLTFIIVGSGLAPQFWPGNTAVFGNELRISSNLPSLTNPPIISSVNPGTLIVRMSLRTSAASFDPNQSLNLRWRNSNDPPLYTKISCFINNIIVEITNPAFHYVDSTTIGISPISSAIPNEYKLHQNYPNPFNPATKIRFELPERSDVKIVVYDMRGRQVQVLNDKKLEAGIYENDWDASSLPSGVYFYTIRAGNFFQTKRMTLIK